MKNLNKYKLFPNEEFQDDFYSRDSNLLRFIESVINKLGRMTKVLILGEYGVGKTLISNIITEYHKT